jgi:hypothetical protein
MATNRGRDYLHDADTRANIYGCVPCPHCGSRYRWPTKDTIVCDDCDSVWDRIDKRTNDDEED